MPLFRKTAKYDFRTDFLPQSNKHRHLDRVAHLNKVVVREPKQPETTVVFLPYPNFDNPNYRAEVDCRPDLLDPDDTRSIGPWLLPVEGVRYFGKNPVTLLFDNPDEGGFIPREHHPINMIFEACRRVVKSRSPVTTPFGSSASDKWDVLLNGVEGGNGEPGSFGCLKEPGRMAVAYALVYTLGKENPMVDNGGPLGGGAGDKPVVFLMSRDTTGGLLDAFDAFLQDPKEPRDTTGSLFVHLYDRKTGVCSAKAAQVASANVQLGAQRRTGAFQSQPQQGQLAGYSVHLTRTLSGRPNDPMLPRQMAEQQAVNTLLPWEEVLIGHTPQQCAEIVAATCGLPLSLLYFAWKSRPEFYTDEIKTALKNPVSQNFVTPTPPTSAAATKAGPVNPFGFGNGYVPPLPAPDAAPEAGEPAAPEGDTYSDAFPPDAGSHDPGYDPDEAARIDQKMKERLRQAARNMGQPPVPPGR